MGKETLFKRFFKEAGKLPGVSFTICRSHGFGPFRGACGTTPRLGGWGPMFHIKYSQSAICPRLALNRTHGNVSSPRPVSQVLKTEIKIYLVYSSNTHYREKQVYWRFFIPSLLLVCVWFSFPLVVCFYL